MANEHTQEWLRGSHCGKYNPECKLLEALLTKNYEDCKLWLQMGANPNHAFKANAEHWVEMTPHVEFKAPAGVNPTIGDTFLHILEKCEDALGMEGESFNSKPRRANGR